MGIGERCSFYRDRGNLLAHGEHLRHADGEVGEKGGQCGASLVAGAWLITPFLLEMRKETQHRIEREVFER